MKIFRILAVLVLLAAMIVRTTGDDDNVLSDQKDSNRKILVMMPPYATAFTSSTTMFMEEVAYTLLEGYFDVTIFGPSGPIRRKNPDPRMKFIPHEIDYDLPEVKLDYEYMKSCISDCITIGIPFKFFDYTKKKDKIMCEKILSNDQLMNRLREEKFHLSILTVFPGYCDFIISDFLNIPFAGVTVSLEALFEPHMYNNALNIPTPLATMSSPLFNITGLPNFKERAFYVATYLLYKFFVMPRVVFFEYVEIKQKFAINPHESLNDLLGKTEILFLNSFLGIMEPRALPPNVHYIGGLNGQGPVEKLPDDMDLYINTAGQQGVVYMALGSFVTKLFADASTFIVFNSITNLDQRLMVSWKGTYPEKVISEKVERGDIRIWTWMPQYDILAHPDVLVFINHCGVNSIMDSLTHQKPMVCLVGLGDSAITSEKCERLGFCVSIQIKHLTAETLKSAVNTVILDPTYKQNAKKISKMMLDRLDDPKKILNFWVGHWFRNNGSEFTKITLPNQLNFFQYFLIDVIIFYAISFIVVLYIVYKILKVVFRAVLRLIKKVKRD